MTQHRTGTREQWLAERRELLAREKQLTRLGDELAAERRALPWVPVEQDYVFEGSDGIRTLADLFDGRSQLLVYHFMFGPDWSEGCASCSLAADHFDGAPLLHLAQRDVSFVAVSRAPYEKLAAYQERMGWTFPWVSSQGSDFNYDYRVSFTPEQQASGGEYNFAPIAAPMDELHGLSAFALADGVVHHTYSSYGRGVEPLLGVYALLDRAPNGRNEDDLAWSMAWIRRHDQYAGAAA